MQKAHSKKSVLSGSLKNSTTLGHFQIRVSIPNKFGEILQAFDSDTFCDGLHKMTRAEVGTGLG